MVQLDQDQAELVLVVIDTLLNETAQHKKEDGVALLELREIQQTIRLQLRKT